MPAKKKIAYRPSSKGRAKARTSEPPPASVDDDIPVEELLGHLLRKARKDRGFDPIDKFCDHAKAVLGDKASSKHAVIRWENGGMPKLQSIRLQYRDALDLPIHEWEAIVDAFFRLLIFESGTSLSSEAIATVTRNARVAETAQPAQFTAAAQLLEKFPPSTRREVIAFLELAAEKPPILDHIRATLALAR